MHRDSPSPSESSARSGNEGGLPSWTSLDTCGDAASWTSWTTLADVDESNAAPADHDANESNADPADHDANDESGERLSGDGFGLVGGRVTPQRLGDAAVEDAGVDGDIAGDDLLRTPGGDNRSPPSRLPPDGDVAPEVGPDEPARATAGRTRVAYPLPGIRGDGFAARERQQDESGAHAPDRPAENVGDQERTADAHEELPAASEPLPLHYATPPLEREPAPHAPAAPAPGGDSDSAAQLEDIPRKPEDIRAGDEFAPAHDLPRADDSSDTGWFPDPAVMAELDALANTDGPAGENDDGGEAWGDFSQFMQAGGPESKSGVGEIRSDAPEGFSALDLRDRVVIMLLFKQVVRIDDVHKVYERWRKQGGGKARDPLWRVLANDPGFDREMIFAEAAQVYAFKEAAFERNDAIAFIKRHCETFAEEAWGRMRELRVLPIRQEVHATKKEKRTIFISHDPSRLEVNRLMRELRLDSFELQYAPEAAVDALIQEAFPKRNEYLDRVSEEEFAYDLGTSYDASVSLIDEDALEAEISRSSLINLFEASLIEAVRQGASDIHIFPNARKQIEIHFRINGELECWHCEERVHPEALLAVVKDNTLNVDRFERDAAQDGFIQRKVDDTIIRYRVSVLPVANANQQIRSESIVIRVLDDRKVITDLSRLGLLAQARAKFEWAIRQPHGMVILTGPTGSGKTTTLFAALHQVVTPKVNVLTVEDPVEYVIPGVRQIKLSHKLNVEQALRSILRHDPDIVMVGEMRDRETADLAIKLANTGHLTFSTLHTNDAPSAVSRLYKMGVEPFLIAYAINLIVAQRLMRTLCPQCKRPADSVDHEMLRRLGFTTEEIAEVRLFDEGGKPDCRSCAGTGYKGRRAITETMAFTPEIRRTIILAKEMINEDALRDLAVADGMLTLRASAREVVKQGETSIAELIRVTAGEH